MMESLNLGLLLGHDDIHQLEENVTNKARKEYEIHHWELYHDENTKLEDLTHPEDIEHFRKHEEMEDEQERLELMKHRRIVEENIPDKFRRSG